MARTNLAVLPDVSGCLRDAMDLMFNSSNQNRLNPSGNTHISSEDNNDVIVDVVNDDEDNNQSLTDALQSAMNKRKLTSTATNTPEEKNGSDSAKRLCTTTEQR